MVSSFAVSLAVLTASGTGTGSFEQKNHIAM
jgi:hypothetical protein